MDEFGFLCMTSRSLMKLVLCMVWIKGLDGLSDTYCSDLWYGIQLMASGVDLTSFDPYSKDAGFKLDSYVVDITCDEERYWENPLNEIQYSIPDQLGEPPLSLEYSVTDSFVSLETSSTSLQTKMSAMMGVSYVFGMFSGTARLQDSYSVYTDESRLIGFVNSTDDAFKIEFPTIPSVTLADAPLNYLKSISPIFNESSVDDYEKFFQVFGTHYCQKMNVGGWMQMAYYSEHSLLNIMSENDIQDNAKLTYSQLLQQWGATPASNTSETPAKIFTNSTLFESTCSPDCPDSQLTFNEWKSDAAADPSFLSGTYDFIYNLIDGSSDLKSSMKLATLNYLAKSFINNQVLPALSIYSSFYNQLGVVHDNSSCPLPNNTIAFNTHNCLDPTEHLDKDLCCNSAEVNLWCAVPSNFTATMANLTNSVKYVSSLLVTLTEEANAITEQSIMNLTQVNEIGSQFDKLTRIMQSGVENATCSWAAPIYMCVVDGADCGSGYTWCPCGTTCDGSPASCPTTPLAVNSTSYLSAMNVANITA